MLDPLLNRNIALGVTGSIACYKAVDIASKLVQASANVDVIMTRAACEFVTPLTFRSLTHRPVTTSVFESESELSINHVAIAERSDAILIAPATANTIAKLAAGLADDALLTTVLATSAPVLIAPAMDANMYDNPATQENVAKLIARGITFAGPLSGRLASGLLGKGRMVEPLALLDHLRVLLGKNGDLKNRKIVISAGGTHEAIDPVRIMSNHSTGKMGYALAEAARDRGASVVLVSAPTALPDPIGMRVEHIESALQMRDAILTECEDADAVVMAAAVADWRASEIANQKVKKTNSDTWQLDFVKNPDILKAIDGERTVKVGFAAESEDLLANAQSKLLSKGLHLIIANDITATDSGFGTDTNRVIILDREGGQDDLPLLTKYEVGHKILDRVLPLLNNH